MRALIAATKKGGVDETTLGLVHLRVSQINGCSFCVDMDWKSVIELGEEEARRRFAVSPFRLGANRHTSMMRNVRHSRSRSASPASRIVPTLCPTRSGTRRLVISTRRLYRRCFSGSRWRTCSTASTSRSVNPPGPGREGTPSATFGRRRRVRATRQALAAERACIAKQVEMSNANLSPADKPTATVRAQTLPLQGLVNVVIRGLLRAPLLSLAVGKRLITVYVVGRRTGAARRDPGRLHPTWWEPARR